MILKNKYLILCLVCVVSLLVMISSIDYIQRLAFLIQVFIKSGLIYKILDFKFLGLTYIIVYVGAISILFLFVIKMTEAGRSPNLVKREEPYGWKLGPQKGPLAKIWPLSPTEDMGPKIEHVGDSIYSFFTPSYTSDFVSITDIEALGFILYLSFPLITILIAILLWCVLIGILRISKS